MSRLTAVAAALVLLAASASAERQLKSPCTLNCATPAGNQLYCEPGRTYGIGTSAASLPYAFPGAGLRTSCTGTGSGAPAGDVAGLTLITPFTCPASVGNAQITGTNPLPGSNPTGNPVFQSSCGALAAIPVQTWLVANGPPSCSPSVSATCKSPAPLNTATGWYAVCESGKSYPQGTRVQDLPIPNFVVERQFVCDQDLFLAAPLTCSLTVGVAEVVSVVNSCGIPYTVLNGYPFYVHSYTNTIPAPP